MVNTKGLSKKAIREIVGGLIKKYPLGVLFTKDDVQELNKRLNQKFSLCERRKNFTYPNDPAHLWVCIDGVWDSFSWNKAISPIDEKQHAKRAMRAAVKQDIAEVREILLEASGKCADDSTSCNYKFPLEVDHKDTSFDAIAESWIKKNGIPELEKKKEKSGAGWLFKNISYEASWVTFHAANANYQLLCKSCNAAKGK